MKFLLCIIIYAVNAVYCRKYDIDTESLKMFGEDLRAVLLKFRKSPEYLSILEDKIQEMRAQLKQISANVEYYYDGLLDDKIIELIDVKTEGDRKLKMLRSKFKRDRRDHRQFLRQETTGAPSTNPLDQYLKQRLSMTTDRTNMFKDMGFQYAGYAIHTIIKHMGSDDGKARSTRLPYGGEFQIPGVKTTSTTEHHDHMITSTVDVTEVEKTEATPTVDAFRYTYKHRSHL